MLSKLDTALSRYESPMSPPGIFGSRHSLRDGPAVIRPVETTEDDGPLLGGDVVVVVGV
jgi:hypothetical protein